MGAGASSTKSNDQIGQHSLVNRESALKLAQKTKNAAAASRIQDLEAAIRQLEDRASQDAARIQTLEAQLQQPKSRDFAGTRHDAAAVSSTSHKSATVHCSVDYAKSISLSAMRRDNAHMRAVFVRHKDVDGGLSKTALIAALNEVKAPLLFSNDGDSEDIIFRRADTNASGYVDESEYASAFSLRSMQSVCSNAAMHRFKLAANLPDDLEMFLADHSLSVM